MSVDALRNRVRDGSFRAGVVGLGYVGLPLAITIAEAGVEVVGYDLSKAVVDQISSGTSSTVDVSDDRVGSVLGSGRLVVTADVGSLSTVDAVFICVPSPLGVYREPDLSMITSAVADVAEVLRPGVLVCLESTTYPGTTREIVLPAVTATGLRLDEDVVVAYSSERVSPGSGFELREIPKVVGGVSALSTTVAAEVYGTFVDEVVVVDTAEIAEFSKLLENTYRSVNIALINELSRFAHGIGVDIWDAIDAAASKPFGFTPFYPGPGVGGHCIPLDPQYLAWRARREGVSLSFIDTAERVNRAMPPYVVDRVAELLNARERSLRGASILAVGIAYKPDVGDDRESAARQVVDLLMLRGAQVEVLDPLFDDAAILARGLTPAGEPLGAYDLAIILTHHTGIDYERVIEAAPVVFDTRNHLEGDTIVRL